MTPLPPPVDPDADDPVTGSRMDRLRAEQAKVVGRLERTRRRLEESRPRSRLLDAVFGAAESDVAAGGGVLAGAVAFRVFLFLVPYVFMLVVVFGLGASAADEDPGTLARKSGIGGVAAKAFAGVGDLSTGERIVSFLVAGFALVLATRALLKVLRIVHTLIWRTRAGKVPSMARAAGMLVLIVTFALAVSVLIGKLPRRFVRAGARGEHPVDPPPGGRMALRVVAHAARARRALDGVHPRCGRLRRRARGLAPGDRLLDRA